MISPAYAQQMAAYNAWQNNGIRAVVLAMDEADLKLDRGAFFGSIFGTLNHLLWGDMLWMARFDGGEAQSPVIAQSVSYADTIQDWAQRRVATDQRIVNWSANLTDAALAGDLSWYSGSINADVTKPKATCVTHFFNHQTHHRGQIHAMLTAAGQKPEATDLVFMPES